MVGFLFVQFLSKWLKSINWFSKHSICTFASENKITKKKGTIMYIVLDSCNKPLRRFSSWQDAFNYKTVCQRYDWTISRIY